MSSIQPLSNAISSEEPQSSEDKTGLKSESETIDDSNIKGIKITKNNDTSTYLFLPAAGDISGKNFGGVGTNLHYWTGSSASDTWAYYLYFNGATVYPEYSFERYMGFTIRPVRLVEVE